MKEVEQVRQGLGSICPVWSEAHGAFSWFQDTIVLLDDKGQVLKDCRDRWIGAKVSVKEYTTNEWASFPAGTWSVRIQQTRDGIEFGAYQRETPYKSAAEVLAHVEKYFKGAKTRAGKFSRKVAK